LVTGAFAQTTGKHPFTFEDMMKLRRVQEPMPSPDGKWVVFAAEDVDLEANTKIAHLWIVPANGGESKRLNETANHEERPRFSPDGKRLIWTSKATDPMQIWIAISIPKRDGWLGRRIRSPAFRLAPTARSGRRMERTSCSCRRFIRIAKTMSATSSAMKS
jgi:dipeptidyl aminopeptidase/acylaminoacyl peptidase